MSDSKSGPLTLQDLINVWTAAVDPTYGAAFIQAGEGGGFEAYTQAFTQYARASTAIDVSTQACYTLGWSGQSNPQAQGGALAQVQLTFQRTGRINETLRLGAGLIYYDEQTNDWSLSGSTPILTGRRYVMQQDLVFLPGDTGPITITAYAEKFGYGYNNPRPKSINFIEQPGSGFFNILATVQIVAGVTPLVLPPPVPSLQINLITQNTPDTIIPQHVGQYLLFTAGANTGQTARIVGFLPPVVPATSTYIYSDIASPPLPPPGIPTSPIGTGSTAALEDMVAFENFGTATGTFIVNETVLIKSGVTIEGSGIFVATTVIAAPSTHKKFGFVLTSGAAALGNTITGTQSLAVASLDLVYQNPTFAAEAPVGLVGGASWKVLDWVNDYGLTVTNAAQPTGGCIGMLDGIGADKNLPRLTGETDAAYSQRIWQIADVVSPNAIRRTLNRILGTIPWCFREVGSALQPGFFFVDANDPAVSPGKGGDAYDYDIVLFNGTSDGTSFIDPTSYYGTAIPFPITGSIPIGGVTVTNVTVAAGVATITTATAHQFRSGNEILLRSVLATLASTLFINGPYQSITVTGANTFTILVPAGTFTYVSGGTVVRTTVGFQEQVQFQDVSGNVKAFGYYSSQNGAFTQLAMIRKGGQGTIADPITVATGDKVVGLVSGAVFNVTSITPVTSPTVNRFHYWLDYVDFRAEFLVGVPRTNVGEFGFAFGVLPHGSPNDPNAFYDGTPLLDFFDGYPAGEAGYYQRIYEAIDKIRAGGVSFYLYQEDATCT